MSANTVPLHANHSLTRYRAGLVLLALVILAAFAIRLLGLTRESFWADEGWTMLLINAPTLQGVIHNMVNDQHPALYFALMHGWVKLAGESPLSVRYLSLLWALIGVAAIYRLGADSYGRRVGVIAAVLLALADLEIYLAQDARHYSQLAALATISTLGYMRHLRNAQRGAEIVWLLGSVALMYTHYLGALLLIVQLGHLLIFARPLRRTADMLVRWLAIWIAWLPWAFIFVGQSLVRYTRPIIFQSTYPNTPEALAIVRNDLVGSHFGLTIGLMLLGLLHIRYRAGQASIRWRPIVHTLYVAAWVLIPVIVIIGINPRFPILTPRNFVLIVPAIALLVAHGVANLEPFTQRLALVILIVVNLITVDAYFVKPPWRQISQHISSYYRPNEPVLMNVWTDSYALQYHLGRDLATPPAQLPITLAVDWFDRYGYNYYPQLLPRLGEQLAAQNTLWIAHWGEDAYPVFDWLRQGGWQRTAERVETHLGVNRIAVYRYDRAANELPPLAVFGGTGIGQFALVRADADRLAPDQVRVNLLWRTLASTDKDYSISVFLLDSAGRSVANVDSPPQERRSPMPSWKVGDLRFDSKLLTLPAGTPSGDYKVGVKIYFYADPKPLTVQSVNGTAEYAVVENISLGGLNRTP